jgi:hypothetical protein
MAETPKTPEQPQESGVLPSSEESEGGFTVGDLKKMLDGAPDNMPVVVEIDLGQGGMVQAEITGCAKGDNALLLFSNDGD